MRDKRHAEFMLQSVRAMDDSDQTVQIVPTLQDTTLADNCMFHHAVITPHVRHTSGCASNVESFLNIPTTVDTDDDENAMNAEESVNDVRTIFMTSDANNVTSSNVLRVPSAGNTFLSCSNVTQNGARHKYSTGSENLTPLSDFAKEDAKFKEAQNEAAHGNWNPLIKEELKYTIQSKRLKEGKGELKVEFTEPSPDVLTPEEEERVEKRRVQNREAARRFRDRQKNKGNVLQKECQRLESITTQLRYELSKVTDERDELRTKLEEHIQVCPLQNLPTGFYR